MKQGRTLTELAKEIERQSETKRDFVVNTPALEMIDVPQADPNFGVSDGIVMQIRGGDVEEEFPLTDHAHNQLADRLGIPRAYYSRMKADSPDLLARNVNTWFNVEPERRMVRTLDRRMRAFLSDRYHPYDNFDVMEIALGELANVPGTEIVSAEVTDSKLYLKTMFTGMEREVTTTKKVGEIMRAGLMISNSEVGLGTLAVSPYVTILSCLNGAHYDKLGMSSRHVGRAFDGNGGDEPVTIFSDETLRADDKAFWLKVRDVIRHTMTDELFDNIAQIAQSAAGVPIEDPVKAVEIVQTAGALREGEGKGFMKYLIEGGDLSLWGAHQAITRMSQDVDSYDRASELERFGADLLYSDAKPIREARKLLAAAA